MEEFFLTALNEKDYDFILTIGPEMLSENQTIKKSNQSFTGDMDSQLKYFSQAIDASEFEKCLNYFHQMALLEKSSTDLDDLLNAYDEIIRDRRYSAFYKRKMEILLTHERLAEAMHDFCDCVLRGAANPNLKALFMLCDFYMGERNEAAAKSCMQQLLLNNPADYVAYLKQAEIECRMNGNQSAKAFAYFKQAWDLQLKELKHVKKCENNHQMAENWTFNRLARFYEKEKPPRKRSERDIITFAAILLFCIILIYNFYSNFQLVILLILVINLVSIN